MNYPEEMEKLCRENLPVAPPGAFDDIIQAVKRDIFLESARTFGTPHYLLDLEALKTRARYFSDVMRRHIPQGEFFYAFKCNDLPLQVKTLKDTGFQADVAGPFELELALKLGFEHILFSSPGKTREELARAVKERKRVIINIDNMDELLRLLTLTAGKKLREKVQVGFRLNSELTTRRGVLWSKFGLSLDELPQAAEMVRQSSALEWRGLHFHASWNKNPSKYVGNIQRIGTFLKERFSPGILAGLRFFDIGGGYYPENQGILHKGEDKGLALELLGERTGDKDSLYAEYHFNPHAFSITPVEPLENFSRAIAAALKEFILPFNPDIKIYFEPGRFIAFPATAVLLSVLAVKGDCVIVDGGINMLGDYKFSEYSFGLAINLTRPSLELRKRTIYGPLCDPHDLWGYSHYGDELQKDDLVAVLQQGAYTYSTAWRFIKPIPPYIAFDKEGGFIVAHKRETFRDRYAGCAI